MSRELGDHLDTRPQCERIPETNPLDELRATEAMRLDRHINPNLRDYIPTLYELRQAANVRISNNATNTILGYIQKLEAEYGPLVTPMPWYKRLYYRWVYKLKVIVKVIKE